MYYIKVAGKAKHVRKAVAHIWTGEDTLCLMSSTGGMTNSTYQLFDTTMNKKVCQNCLGVLNKQ